MTHNATSLAWVGTHSCIHYMYSGYWDIWLESWDQGWGSWDHIYVGIDLARPYMGIDLARPQAFCESHGA